MSPVDIGLLALGALVLFVLAGMLVPVALMLISFLGVWAIKGSPDLGIRLMAQAANDAISNYFFGIVPLFVLMGFVVAETGMGQDAYAIANRAFRRVRGGLGIATVAANAVFAAITGISIASAAVFTRIATPEMIRYGYSPRFATGVVAGSSVLGMLIPPSLLLILFAIIAEQSVGDLFLAGILPGLLLAALFCLLIVIGARFWPDWAGTAQTDPTDDDTPDGPRLLRNGLPIALLIGIVLGGIYSGFFSPIDAGAVGSVAAILIALVQSRLSLSRFGRILVETGLVTASICMLIVAAQIYSRMLAFSGLPAGLAEFIAGSGMGYWSLMLIYVLVLIGLGMILDSSSILLIVVPIMLPVVQPMGLDLVWFGIVTVLTVEIGLLTPPFGLSVFVIKATLEDRSISLGDIFRGSMPFAGAMLLVVALLLAFPALATALIG